MKRIKILVSGIVIGVNFRDFIEENASKLNVKGWVRNTEDNKVEGLFEGREEDVDSLVDLCRKGPSAAGVEKIKLKEEKYSGEFSDFKKII